MNAPQRQESTRIATTEAILALMDSDPRITLVVSDSLLVIKGGPIVERYPDRVVEVGIAEQSGVDVAAGLASAGLIPFFVTYAGFITMRACEQVRTFVGYSHLNVKFVGANGGIAGGEREGPTHQFIEDIGIMRMVPGMTVVVPADASQVREAIKAVAAINGPAYVRIGSGRDPVVFDDPPLFELGKVRVLEEVGTDVAIFACGAVLPHAIHAVSELRETGIGATLVEVHTVKPIDAGTVAEISKRCGAAVSVEDHTILGGLGSAVAEVVTANYPVPVERIGILDTFARSGAPEELLDEYHMGVSDIVHAARRALARRKT
jgi:transketolase